MAAKLPQMPTTIDLIYRYFPELKLARDTVQPCVKRLVAWLYSQKVFIIIKMYLYIYYDYVMDFTFVSENRVLLGLWLMSHCMTLVFSMRFVSQLIRSHTWSLLDYHACLYGSMLTYTIVSYKHLTLLSNKKLNMGIESITRSENTFLLINTIIALNSPHNLLKLVPFALYSFLNIYIAMLDEYFKHTLTAKILLPHIGVVEERTLYLSSIIEIGLLGVYGLNMINNNNKALLVYFFVLTLRMESSEYIKSITLLIFHFCHRLCVQNFPSAFKSYPVATKHQSRGPRKRVASLNFETLNEINSSP